MFGNRFAKSTECGEPNERDVLVDLAFVIAAGVIIRYQTEAREGLSASSCYFGITGEIADGTKLEALY